MKQFFDDFTNQTGKGVGSKIFQNGTVIDEAPKTDGPYIAFTQRANHLYLYKKGSQALNNTHCRKNKTAYVDYREYTRDLTCIPKELLSKFAPLKPQLTLWQLKSDKNKKPEIEAEIKEYTKLQPGCFSPSI